MELTIDSALEVLREMFPDALRIYISDDADYFDGTLKKETFILINHRTFRAASLGGAMSQVYAAQSKRTDLGPNKSEGHGHH